MKKFFGFTIAMSILALTLFMWAGNPVATIVAGASPSNTFRIQYCSEAAGTSVYVQAGSFLKYRIY